MLFGIIDKDHLVRSIKRKLKYLKWDWEWTKEHRRRDKILDQLHCETLEDIAVVMQYFYGDKYKITVRDGVIWADLPEREKAV